MTYKKNIFCFFSITLTVFIFYGCKQLSKTSEREDGGKFKLIILDPAHGHAAGVQERMYPGVDSVVHVYAPKGLGLKENLNSIERYNKREEEPTHWVENVYAGDDFLDQMLSVNRNNPAKYVVILAGNNRNKPDYIKKSIDAGLNVLADKPMAINLSDFYKLKQAFEDAEKQGLILYDIMTERYVMASILQKTLAHIPSVFGELKQGTVDSPSVIMKNVHSYFKHFIRPIWFFDPTQEGGAIVDVGTHLVDLVQWECFPETLINYKTDIQVNSAKIWPTPLTLTEFSKITKENKFPDFLEKYIVNDSILLAHGNGEINYSLKGKHVKVTSQWFYQAPGGGDSYYALLRGTKADLERKESDEDPQIPVLYVWPKKDLKNIKRYTRSLKKAVKSLKGSFPEIKLERYKSGWKISSPKSYPTGHEGFSDVVKQYFEYLKEGDMPEWEKNYMISKYYITTKALNIAKRK